MKSKRNIIWIATGLLLSLSLLTIFMPISANTGMEVLWEQGVNVREHYIENKFIGYSNDSEVMVDYIEYDLTGTSTKEYSNITAGLLWKSPSQLVTLITGGGSVHAYTILDQEITGIEVIFTYDNIASTYVYDNATGVLVTYSSEDGSFMNLLSWTEVDIHEYIKENDPRLPGFIAIALPILGSWGYLTQRDRSKVK